MSIQVDEIEFDSHGTRLRAGLFHAANDSLRNSKGLPCVVMAHGLGGTRDCGLEPFARRFADAGLMVLCFDYRGFGSSDGEPRQWVSVKRQLQDWASAIGHARTLKGVDPDRIATWGSSFSGAHSVAAAVADGRIAAVSSQGAMMDGIAALIHLTKISGPVRAAQLTALAARDALSSRLGLGRVMRPVVGYPGEDAVLTTPDCMPGYHAIAPAHWRNEITLDWMLSLALYRPNRLAARLPCPAIFCIAQDDQVVPPKAMEDAARRAGDRVEVHRFPVGHFEIYVPPTFQKVSKVQADFFARILSPRS